MQTEHIARLEAANKQLRVRVAELERRLNRNSGNSNLPPSTDVFGRPRRSRNRSQRSGRARGKQKGQPGNGLALVEEPDRIEDHRPSSCAGGGEDRAEVPSQGFARRQVSDIPLVMVKVTGHGCTVRCDCGQVTAADAPEGVAGSPASYGPNLRALAVYLLVHQHIPVEHTAELIADLTGAEVSTGWVSGLLVEGAVLVEDCLDLIRALLVLGHVLHADETTTRIGSRRHWLHVACTENLTLLGLAPRSRAGADSLGVLPGFRGTLVHDSLSLCGAHLIRELTAAEQDTTCARAHGLVHALNRLAATLGIPTLTDLGYENAADGFRYPVKEPKGGELAESDKAFNAVIRGVHAVAERANALLKVTFKALRRVSLDPAAISR